MSLLLDDSEIFELTFQMDGFGLLSALKQDKHLAMLPVIML
jgi:hypothetical protein